MSRTTLKIDGMSCMHCVAAVKQALQGVDGVTVENVAVGSATVSYDPAVVSPAKLAEAIEDAGYSAAPAA